MNTNPNKKNKRDVQGILLLDKPTGLTSNAALQIVKRLFNAKKAGHTGSLDPLASGLLPLCFGEATKFSQYLLESDKYYQVTAKLGIKTSTADAEGEAIEQRPVPSLTAADIEKILVNFRGDITQIPSMFSAIKHQGQPLYKLARQGIEIERQPRPVTIYKLQLMAQTADTLDLEVACSKGTYIRNLVEDIGEALGCGAHVTVLRRLEVGPYKAEQMLEVADIEALLEEQGEAALDQLLLPVDTAVDDWTTVNLTETTAFYIRQGQPVLLPQLPNCGTWVRLVYSEQFLGIGEVLEDGMLAPRRLVAG